MVKKIKGEEMSVYWGDDGRKAIVLQNTGGNSISYYVEYYVYEHFVQKVLVTNEYAAEQIAEAYIEGEDES